jgi:glycosyltransferase involved in cell wall biosynthesis
MKILFYNHTGQVSGAERVLLMILSRLDRTVFEPVLLCPEQGPLKQMGNDLDVQAVAIGDLKARFTWRLDVLVRYCKSFFAVIRELRRQVVAHQPELVHANSIRSGLAATAATVGLKTGVVWHLHDLLPRHPLSTAIRIFALLSKRTRLIAVSDAVAGNFCGRRPRLLSKLLRRRVSVILNSIDLEKFQAHESSGRAIRKELRFRETDFALGIVGQLTPRKGQLELLRAFAGSLREFPNSVLLIAGAPLFNRDHEYLQLLKQTVAELGIGNKVRTLGARNDVAAIMQACDLLVVNSSAEPFGLVVLEAMACGTPVLATAVDGIPEIIKHDENGWLIPAHDEAALAAAIVQLQRRPLLCERLAAKGKQRVAAHFAVERYMKELQLFYNSSTNVDFKPRQEQAALKSQNRQAEAA